MHYYLCTLTQFSSLFCQWLRVCLHPRHSVACHRLSCQCIVTCLMAACGRIMHWWTWPAAQWASNERNGTKVQTNTSHNISEKPWSSPFLIPEQVPWLSPGRKSCTLAFWASSVFLHHPSALPFYSHLLHTQTCQSVEFLTPVHFFLLYKSISIIYIFSATVSSYKQKQMRARGKWWF